MSKKRLFDSRFRVVKYGHEVAHEDMQADHVYMVHYILSGKTAEKLGIDKFQWGVIVVDHTGCICRNYNLEAHRCWSKSSEFKLTKGHRLFEPTPEDKEFALNAVSVDNQKAQFDRLRNAYYEKQEFYIKRQSHWLHKFVDWFIR